jgi:hypothetical protein
MFKSLFAKSGQREDRQAAAKPSRICDVGWLFAEQKSSVIWDSPYPIRPDAPDAASAKSVAYCPAVVEFDRRHFVINAPIDVHLHLTITPDGKLNITNVLGDRGTIRSNTFSQMLVIMPQHEWRQSQRPVIQLSTPYIFVADEPVYVNQFPPFLHHGVQRPGLQLCGRYPIDVWPRQLMWAFEWHDLSKDLVIKRGEPWFYVRFETADPAASVRLVEAENTPELQAYIASITDVTNYVNQTFSLFKTARERRPERLLVPKPRADRGSAR